MLGTFVLPTIINKYAKLNPNVQIQLSELGLVANRQALLDRDINLGAFMFNQVIEHEPSISGIQLKEPIDLEIVIAYRKDANLNNLSKAFLDFIVNFNKKISTKNNQPKTDCYFLKI